MAAPKKIPASLKGQYSRWKYVVIKNGEIIYQDGCSLRAFPKARREKAAIYDGADGKLIEDYTT